MSARRKVAAVARQEKCPNCTLPVVDFMEDTISGSKHYVHEIVPGDGRPGLLGGMRTLLGCHFDGNGKLTHAYEPDPSKQISPTVAESVTKPWVEKITAAHGRAVDAVLETGRLLIAAKKAIPHGNFETMIREQLPFNERWAQMLMRIAGSKQIAKAHQGALLPTSVKALYEVASLDPEVFDWALENNRITPRLSHQDVNSLPHVKWREAQQAKAKEAPPIDPQTWRPVAAPSRKDPKHSVSDLNRNLREIRGAVSEADRIVESMLLGEEHQRVFSAKYADLGKRLEAVARKIARKKTV